MEENTHLITMGKKIKEVRKKRKMNQIDFYRKIYPEENQEEENIKKKMNAIENGKQKRIDPDLLFRIRDNLDVSLDYLFGYETEYQNYESKAASKYTGLSKDAIEQLHFWSKYREKEIPDLPLEHTQEQTKEHDKEYVFKSSAKWILEIASKLIGKKTERDQKTGIADQSILYDLYMMTLDPPSTVLGISEDIMKMNIPYKQKMVSSVTIMSDTIGFMDDMKEVHPIRIKEVYQEIWKERLMDDVVKFASEITRKRHGEK